LPTALERAELAEVASVIEVLEGLPVQFESADFVLSSGAGRVYLQAISEEARGKQPRLEVAGLAITTGRSAQGNVLKAVTRVRRANGGQALGRAPGKMPGARPTGRPTTAA
jgi:hypothetical protein